MATSAASRRTWTGTWNEVDLDDAWYAMLAIPIGRKQAAAFFPVPPQRCGSASAERGIGSSGSRVEMGS